RRQCRADRDQARRPAGRHQPHRLRGRRSRIDREALEGFRLSGRHRLQGGQGRGLPRAGPRRPLGRYRRQDPLAEIGGRMKMARRLALALCMSLASCFIAAGAYAQPLRIPYVSLSPTAGPLWIAYEAGYFKKNNVPSELIYIPGGSVIIQAMISGD